MKTKKIEERIIFDKKNFTLTLLDDIDDKIVLTGKHFWLAPGINSETFDYKYDSYKNLENINSLVFIMRGLKKDGTIFCEKRTFSEKSLMDLRYYLDDILSNNISGLKTYNETIEEFDKDFGNYCDVTKLELSESGKKPFISKLMLFTKKDNTFISLKIFTNQNTSYSSIISISNYEELVFLKKSLDNFFKLYFYKEKIKIDYLFGGETLNKNLIDKTCIRSSRTFNNQRHFSHFFVNDTSDYIKVKLRGTSESFILHNIRFIGTSIEPNKLSFETKTSNEATPIVKNFYLDEILDIDKPHLDKIKDIECTSLEEAASIVFNNYISKSKTLTRDFKIYPIDDLHNKYQSLLSSLKLSKEFVTYSTINLEKIISFVKEKALNS